MKCLIDDTTPAFQRRVKHLRKDFPKIDEDLQHLFEKITKADSFKVHGDGVPGFGNTVWKYRCESSNMNRGKSGGFRILAYFLESRSTLYPFLVYTKKEYEKADKGQPSKNDIKGALSALMGVIAQE